MGPNKERPWDREIVEFVDNEAIPRIEEMINSKLAAGQPVDEVIADVRASLRTLL